MTKADPTFYEVLSEAVADFADHGFDSADRLNFWTEKLRKAAEKMFSRHDADKMLRDSLRSIYDRLVERGKISQYHFGVDRFTINQIKPKLRAELDRRILASANLIKLNRDAAIQKTLQRFQGWSTSIPLGGPGAKGRQKAKVTIYKNLSQLSFEDRRVVIDQGYKLTAAINEIVAVEAGALAAEWHSHWRQAGYNYREEHKARDGKVYAIRGNWALAKGLMKAGPDGYSDEITQPGQEVYCRCGWVFRYTLRSLPKSMLTAKGANALAKAKAVTH